MEGSIYRNIQYEVYQNIFEMIKYRQLTTQTPKIDENLLRETLRRNQEISIDAGETIFIMTWTDPNTKFADYYKIINKAIKNNSRASTKRISLIGNIKVEDNKDILKILKKLEEDWPDIYVDFISYEQIQINWPQCSAYIPHRVLPEDDENIKYIKETHLEMPRIRMNDTGCLWCGGKPKDIIEIKRLNGTIAYRIVVSALM